MTEDFGLPGVVWVVLVDANVMYSRVLRDYLLYSADEEIITVAWSREILSEVTEHLAANVAGYGPDNPVGDAQVTVAGSLCRRARACRNRLDAIRRYRRAYYRSSIPS